MCVQLILAIPQQRVFPQKKPKRETDGGGGRGGGDGGDGAETTDTVEEGAGMEMDEETLLQVGLVAQAMCADGWQTLSHMAIVVVVRMQLFPRRR